MKLFYNLTKRYIPTLLSLPIAIASAMAAPARPGLTEYIQPDGSIISVAIHGDEHVNWYTDSEGNPLRPDSEGFLREAAPTWLAGRLESRRAVRNKERTGRRAPRVDFPASGRQKALVVMVEFQDKEFTFGHDKFEEMLSLPGYSYQGGAGSARDYFIENSYGIFTPEFDLYGPVKLPHPMSYYGGNDDAKAYEMAAEACRQLDAEVDFSQYDRDNDGWIDNIYVFYAGYGEADGGGVNTVWPHSSNIYNKGEILMLDGVMAGNYACSNELVGNTRSMVGIGTFCHEFSHVLGLPDLYPTNGSEIDTPYYWSLMEHGNYNGNGRCPASLTAYEREYLGWLIPIEITPADRGTLRLPTLDEGLAYKVRMPDDENEWYLLETRTKTGWDAFLPGEGLLIWHIDYDRPAWNENRVNNDPSRQRVDLIEAGGNPSMSASAAHPFPGTQNVSSFEAFAPRFSAPLDIKLREIRFVGGAVTMNLHEASGLPDTPVFSSAPAADDITIRIPLPETSAGTTYACSVTWKEEGRTRRLAPYTMKEAQGEALVCEGALPETDYEIRLWGRSGVAFGLPSEGVSVCTAPALFGGLAPVALPAAEISDDAFTANWEALLDAEGYLLSVYTLAEGEAEGVSNGFDNGAALPEGWSSNVATTMSVNGYYGEAAPSLRMTNNVDFLQTPVFGEDITGLSFWMRGYKLPASSRLRVEGLVSGEWSEPLWESGEISNTSGITVSVGSGTIPAGTKALRLVISEPTPGSLCLDDVRIGFGKSTHREYILEAEPVGDALSWRVAGLASGSAYRYSVAGVKGERISSWSDEIEVTLPSSGSGLETISEGNTLVDAVALDGCRIGDKLPELPGIYLLRYADGKVRKVMVK